MLLTTALVLSGPLSVFADTSSDISAANAARESAQNSLNSASSKLSELENEKTALMSYLAELNASVTDLSEQLTDLNGQIEDKRFEIDREKASIVRAQNAEAAQYDDMSTRIRYMYENSSTLLESLLKVGSISDFLNRTEEIRQIQNYDREALKNYTETRQSIEQKKADLEEDMAELETLLTETEVKKGEMEALIAETDQKIAAYTANISAEEMEVSELQAEIDKQMGIIANLEAKAAEEEEARRKAEEEAAKAEQLAKEAELNAQAQEKAEANKKEEDTTVDKDAGSKAESPTTSMTLLGNFRLTAYCDCAKCCGPWAGGHTASGTKPKAGRTVAMNDIPFGTRLYINGVIYTVEDRGTPYGHVDIFMDSHSACYVFGDQRADVFIVN
ncbi:MAG: hypothetical protein Q4B73_03700 [Lachnospiraceae bacterium]|nr:hypothetical protein [Lachnospiraceae bacterium]